MEMFLSMQYYVTSVLKDPKGIKYFLLFQYLIQNNKNYRTSTYDILNITIMKVAKYTGGL